MRPVPWLAAEPYRLYRNDGYGSNYGDPFGCFEIPYQRTAVRLTVIVSDGDYKATGLSDEYAWEHVSVSLKNRTPNWAEMDFICRIFWRDDETVMQLHVPPAENISRHANCLHLWRPLKASIPRPPGGAVG